MISLEKLIYLILINFVLSRKTAWIRSKMHFQSKKMKDLLKEKKITQQMVFLKADIPEKYGYKLLSGEKHTRQRDIILRICYAAELTLEQTQRALRKYEMPQLYAKIPRDALLMLIFKDRPGGIIEVNELLSKNGMEMLRTSGVQE